MRRLPCHETPTDAKNAGQIDRAVHPGQLCLEKTRRMQLKRRMTSTFLVQVTLSFVLVVITSPIGVARSQDAAFRKEPRIQQNPRGAVRSPRVRQANAPRLRSAPAFPTWAYAFQGDREDEARGVFEATDGGVLFWGDTRILGKEGLAWMTKLSGQGQVEWSRVLVTGDGTVFHEITRTSDGGFIAAGHQSGQDAIILKLSSSCLPEWCVLLGTDMGDAADSVQQTADGGYIAAGVTTAFYDTRRTDYWVAKLTAAGALEWSWIVGGPGDEGDFMNGAQNATIRQSVDGGYFLVGSTNSSGAGGRDICVFKLTSLGTIAWQRTFGGTGVEELANSGPHAVTTPDGGLVIACTTGSFVAAARDGWIFRITEAGDIVWQKRIGGPQADEINAFLATSDGGYAIGGVTAAVPSDGFRHGWLLKLDQALTVEWQRFYGGGNHFDIQGLAQGADGSYSAGGCRTPTENSYWYWDVYRDAFVMKTGPDGRVGAPGNAFVGTSEAAIADTDAAPQISSMSPLPGFVASFRIGTEAIGVSPQAELLSWTGLQPPLDLTLTAGTNRGLFKGEAFNTLHWSPNPWNSRFELVSYAIYRQPLSGGTAVQIATVPANATAYEDGGLGFNDRYAYTLRSLDANGNVSPVSQTVRN